VGSVRDEAADWLDYVRFVQIFRVAWCDIGLIVVGVGIPLHAKRYLFFTIKQLVILLNHREGLLSKLRCHSALLHSASTVVLQKFF
jgi:hypothetical protein